jgi:hypothetical protein
MTKEITPELINECQAVSRKISNKLSREYGIIMQNMFKEGLDSQIIGITPLMIMALTLASQVNCLTNAYKDDGNPLCTEAKTLETILELTNKFLTQYHQEKKKRMQ